MLHVARLTGEKIKLQQQSMHTPSFPPKTTNTTKPHEPPCPAQKATETYKREHQRQLWRQHEQGQGAAVVYGMMEAWWSRERYRVVMGRVHARRRERGGR